MKLFAAILLFLCSQFSTGLESEVANSTFHPNSSDSETTTVIIDTTTTVNISTTTPTAIPDTTTTPTVSTTVTTSTTTTTTTTTSISSSGGNGIEKRQYPYYSEIAPCPCDLNAGKCEVFCCCDKDCPAASRVNATCIPGLQGGMDQSGKLVDPNCTSLFPWLSVGDEHSLLCIKDANSPYLGAYFEEIDVLNTFVEYDIARRPMRGGQTAGPVEMKEKRQQQYKYGSSVRTIYDLQSGITGKLLLPKRSASGQCLMSPVRYLVGERSSCVTEIKSCQESTFSLLDFRRFLTNSDDSTTTMPKVRANVTSADAAPGRVNYYKAKSAQEYPKLKERTRDINGVKSMSEDLLLLEDEDLQPLVYDARTQMCDNVVLEVEYHLTWAGSKITRVKVDIKLANVSLKAGPMLLTQTFSVYFHRESKVKAKNNTSTASYGGNPGYNRGMDLIAGTRPTTGNRTEMFEEDGLNRWAPDETSLCDTTLAVKSIKFGEDTVSGCMLQLARSNFSSCADLNRRIWNIQHSLVHSESIAKGGNPNHTDPSDFVNIIYDWDYLGDGNATMNKTRSAVEQCIVPWEVHMHIMYSKSSLPSVDPIYRVNGARVTNRLGKWDWSCTANCPKVQKFELRMMVSFEEIPLVWHHQNTSRFWVVQEQSSCHGDICWHELFYPFTSQETGTMISYVTQWALLIVILSLFVLYLTSHYW